MGEQWQRVMALFSAVREATLEPDMLVSHSAGISACEMGEQWQQMLTLVREMREAKLEPDPQIIQLTLHRHDQRVRDSRLLPALAGCVSASSMAASRAWLEPGPGLQKQDR
ncbi:unnamed protein product [Prorocentrum cordatum]|uniref:Pentatricopeptide repeat-containing protein n=1 Tax=Prorocentrum cordatum TaxID=2364126 RepID=A0ABN9TRU1_9DINO|nr:unnamed protein product [Polarella glacialis]